MLLCLSSGTDLQKSRHVLKSLSLCNKVLSYLLSLSLSLSLISSLSLSLSLSLISLSLSLSLFFRRRHAYWALETIVKQSCCSFAFSGEKVTLLKLEFIRSHSRGSIHRSTTGLPIIIMTSRAFFVFLFFFFFFLFLFSLLLLLLSLILSSSSSLSLSRCLSVCTSVCLSVRLSVCLSVCLPACLSLSVSLSLGFFLLE